MSTFIGLVGKGSFPLPHCLRNSEWRVKVYLTAEHQILHSEILPSPFLLKDAPHTQHCHQRPEMFDEQSHKLYIINT